MMVTPIVINKLIVPPDEQANYYFSNIDKKKAKVISLEHLSTIKGDGAA